MNSKQRITKALINRQSPGFWVATMLRFKRNYLALGSLIVLLLLILACIFIPMVSRYSYWATNFSEILMAPSMQHFFGTDELGRDIFVRSFIGGRITFEIALAAMLVVLFIGVIYGSLAGFMGGLVDSFMMRLVDMLYGIPFLFFSILLMTLFGQSILLSFAAIAAISWLDMARVVRGQTISLKHKEFVESAQVSGLSSWQIISRHIIPNLIGVVIIYSALIVPNMIIISAVLSFFGLGVTEPMTSWGLMINNGMQDLNAWWLLVFPTALMVITLLALAFIVMGLRDALDPR